MGCSSSYCFGSMQPKETLYLQKIGKYMDNGNIQALDTTDLVQTRNKDDLLAEANSLMRLLRVREAKQCFKLIISKNLFSQIEIIGFGCCEEQIGHYEHNPIDWYFQNNRESLNPYDALWMCFLVTKEYEQALRWVKKEIDIRPEDYRLVLGLAHTYFNLKQYHQARKLYLKVIDLKQTFDRPYQIIAVIDKLENNNEEKVKFWTEKALSYNPNNYYAFFIQALCEQNPEVKIQKLKRVTKMNKFYGRPYNALGNVYKRVGDAQRAIQSYKKCLKRSPNYEAPYIGLGNIYRQNKMYTTAIEYFQKSIKVNPQIDLAFNGLGNIYNEIENYQKALQNYHNSIRINKAFFASYYGIGVVLKKMNQIDEARSNFQKALELNPNYVLALQGLAEVYLQIGDLDRAKELCLKVIDLKVNKVSAYFILGQVECKGKDLSNAKANYLKCLEIQPNMIESLCALGNIHFREQNFQEALRYFHKCLQISEDYYWAYYYMGKLFKKQKEFEKAEDNFKKCIKIDKNNYSALNAIANLYCEQNRLQDGLSLFLQSTINNPSCFSSHHGLGNAYFMAADYEKAMAAYQRCIEIDRENHQPYNGLGNCFKSLAQFEQAVKCYEKAIQLAPGNDVSYYGIGNIMNLQGNFNEAKQYYLKALERNPTNTLCKMNLGFVYLKMENFKMAFQLISEARDSIGSDIRLTHTNQEYLDENIKIFEEQAEEWEIKKKMGFITEESRANLNKIIDHFEDKVKFLYSSQEEGSNINKKCSLNPGILKIINLLFDQKFKLTEIQNIFTEVHTLFFVDEDYFHIIPQIFCQYFWSQKFLYNRPTSDIEKHLTQLLREFSEKPKSNTIVFRGSQLQEQFNEQLSLSLFENKREKINLFKDTDFFPSYEQLYSEIKMANSKSARHLPEFTQLVMHIKKKTKGFNEKVNLKLPDNSKNEFKVMLRIMEKMFREIRSKKQVLIKNLDNILDNMDNVTIDAVIHEIIGVWTNQINQILQTRIQKKKPTPCYISDLVRGKIFFNSISDIKAAVQRAEQFCIDRKYNILDCENRLSKPETRDVVLKVHIGEAVCELQLAIKQNQTVYHFHHCLYEILRSPLGCIFGSYLFMSKGFKYPFIQNCKDIRDQLKKRSNLKDRVVARKVEYIIKTLERQQIPFKSTRLKRTKSQDGLQVVLSTPIKKSPMKLRNKCREV